MVIVSHDREFLDNLCTKIVETERGVATTYKVGGVPCVCVCWGRVWLLHCTAQYNTTQGGNFRARYRRQRGCSPANPPHPAIP